MIHLHTKNRFRVCMRRYMFDSLILKSCFYEAQLDHKVYTMHSKINFFICTIMKLIWCYM